MVIIYGNNLVEVYTTPSVALSDFIFKAFSIIDFISSTIKTITKNVYVWSVSERVLLNPGYSTNFTYDLHKEWGEKFAASTVGNVFFKHTNDSIRKEQIVSFKKRRSSYFCFKFFLANIPFMV